MIAVVLMAHGTPERLDQMEAYLTRVRHGRPPPPELTAEMRRRYALVGMSPLLALTRAQADALAAELGPDFRTYVGMRTWEPTIADAVAQARADGAAQVIGLPMVSIVWAMGAYMNPFIDALGSELWNVRPTPIALAGNGVHDAFADCLRETIAGAWAPDAPLVVFTAHSLPVRVAANATYPHHVRELADAVGARAGLRAWRIAWQSAGATDEPWLTPDVKDVIAELAAEGAREVVVAPIGFVCDHVEITYDLDVEAREHAARLGVTLRRTPSLNARPSFIRALAAGVRAAVRR